MASLDLQNSVAIITGGASGIGQSIGWRLIQEGVNIVIADVDTEGGQKLRDEMNASDMAGSAIFLEADVTDRDNMEQLASKAVDEFGKIDILVNNAGINIPRLLVDPASEEELTQDLYDGMMAVNVEGAVWCAQAVGRHMVKQGEGVIINMASECALEGSTGQGVYAASKAALYSFTRSWAKELGPHGVRVVGLAPGIMEATSLRNDEYDRALAYTRGISIEEINAAYENASVPLRRVGKLEEVADVVAFVASDMAGYISGTVINVSGGKSRA